VSRPLRRRVDPQRPDPGVVAEAVAVLRAGRLVAFPTETVYGLGADALRPEAVAAIYRAKGRPGDNPLILHLAQAEDLVAVAGEVPPVAWRLSRAFWPGPLTLVLPGRPGVAEAARAGLSTVAVRLPASPLARALARGLGRPVAAPSANRSGRPSATRAQAVLEDLGDREELGLVLDGGPTAAGVESTVLDVTVEPARLLRAGALSLERLRSVLGEEGVVPLTPEDGELARRSPGTRHRHYAPAVPVYLASDGESLRRMAAAWQGGRLGVLASREALALLEGAEGSPRVCLSLGRRAHPEDAARRLFSGLRRLEAAGVAAILAELPREVGLGRAVADRLRRAAAASGEAGHEG
jgi:L-threonylcarbamoyladenylate synthase